MVDGECKCVLERSNLEGVLYNEEKHQEKILDEKF
jgi:hypothetical protein